MAGDILALEARAASAISFAGDGINTLRTKLVAAVVAGLLSAPAAHAQEANVTLYGRINLDMELVNGKQSGTSCPEQLPEPAMCFE